MNAFTRLLFTMVLLTFCGELFAQRAAPPAVAPPYNANRTLQKVDSLLLDWNDASRQRALPVKIYFPVQAAAPCPIILFSHGLGGTRDTYGYLGEQWAANGYACIHLQHPGSDDTAWRGQARPMQSMREAASARNAIDRAEDVRFAIDQLAGLNEKNEKLKGKLDLKAIGVAGHSFGANTAMLVAGQGSENRLLAARGLKTDDSRVKAVIALSAPVPIIKTNLAQIYAPIHIPVFLMTGTEDQSPLNDTNPEQRRIPFDQIKQNAWLLTFQGGDHMVFSGRLTPREGDESIQKLIRLSSTAYWDALLRNNGSARSWLDGEGFKTVLGAAGTLERN
jgi:predicted dienelactone hydrolase